MKKSANISFLFCNSLGSSKDETMKLFADFCTTNKLLVLKVDNKETKVQNRANKKFMLAPYCPDLPLPEDIKLTCLIIELDTINKISNNI
jgi:hypothetical protein